VARTITAIPLSLALLAALVVTACESGEDEESGADASQAAGDDEDIGDADAILGDCEVWEITYDLTGSEFEISGTPLKLGDQVNVVGEPYEAADRIGPASFVLRFADIDGAPGGQAVMVAYQAALHFEVNSPGATVLTNLFGSAGPDGCGITTGTLAGTSVAWMPSAIVGYHSKGEILCRGAFCKQANLPKGKPVAVDEVYDQALSEFVFTDDLTRFSMPRTVIREGPKSVSSWMYEGAEVRRERIAAPACLCK
jgi:hypothetical protein